MLLLGGILIYLNKLIKKDKLKLNLLNKHKKVNYIRKITSVTVLENTSDLSWIKGGEFLLTSMDTFSTIKKEDLYPLFEKFHNKISGIAIKYRTESESENELLTNLIEIAEKLKLPLFQIPATTTYVELMDYINYELRKGIYHKNFKNQLIHFLMINDDQNNMNDEFIKNAIHDIDLNIDLDKDQIQIIRLSFERKVDYFDYIEYYFEVLKVKKKIKDYFVKVENNTNDIMIFVVNTSDNGFEMKDEILNVDRTVIKIVPTIYISSPSDIKNLKSLYFQTLLLKKTRKIFPKMVIQYEDIDLIVNLTNNDKKFSSNYTKPIKELMDNESLVETLLCYYKNNENKKETSEELFIHVNTLNYRLNQISKLTKMDFNYLSDKIRIYLSLFIELIKEDIE